MVFFVTLLFYFFPPISGYEGESLILAISPTLWLPSSPDLNPIHFFICSVFREDTNKTFQTKIKVVKYAVSAGYNILDREAVTHTYMTFRDHPETVNKKIVSYNE